MNQRLLWDSRSFMRQVQQIRLSQAVIQNPGWGGADAGFTPFPANKVVEAL